MTSSIYRKPTFTGLFTNFHSFIPLSYKRSLISCLLHRIFNLCSTYENFHVQLEIVRKLFNLNGFLSHMFDDLVRRFLNNLFEPKPIIHTVPKKMFISAFHSLAHTLFKFALKSPDFAMLLILTLTFDLFFAHPHASLPSFLSIKDKVPKFLRSGVVYLFKCRCCSASYVGQTTRHLHVRISEHLEISPITGKPSSSPVMSSILSHLNTTDHSANFDDFTILSSCSNTSELMIHESLLISKLKPSLNV